MEKGHVTWMGAEGGDWSWFVGVQAIRPAMPVGTPAYPTPLLRNMKRAFLWKPWLGRGVFLATDLCPHCKPA